VLEGSLLSYEQLARDELIGLLVARDERIIELERRNDELAERLARLEHLLTRNSGNSSMPPSRDEDPGHTPPVVKPKSGAGKRKKGKQKGAAGANLSWLEDCLDRREVFPTGCCGCGQDLAGAVDLGIVDRYQQHEIPAVTVSVVQYNQHEVVCGCGRVHVAERPAGARPGPVGYGPNLQALAVYLLVLHHLPVHRVAMILATLTGAAPSVGFVHGMLARTARLLKTVDDRVRTLLTLAHVVCCDETPIRVGSKIPRPGRKKADKYLLVACTDLFTHYLLGDRDLATFQKFVVADLTGVVVHDRYQNYDSARLWDTGGTDTTGVPRTLIHQLCCQHLLRDLASAAETYPDAHWPGQIADALRALVHQANLARAEGVDRLDPQIMDPLIDLIRRGRTVGLSETRHHGNRPGEAKARGLLEALRDREADVLRFIGDLRIPPTSNQAERDLRPAKIQQNTSGRLTSVKRTEDRYLIRGVLSTAIKHRRNAIDVLRDTFTGIIWMPPDPRTA
jgi:transposase